MMAVRSEGVGLCVLLCRVPCMVCRGAHSLCDTQFRMRSAQQSLTTSIRSEKAFACQSCKVHFSIVSENCSWHCKLSCQASWQYDSEQSACCHTLDNTLDIADCSRQCKLNYVSCCQVDSEQPTCLHALNKIRGIADCCT